MRKEYTKVQWTDDMEQFIRDNYKTMHDKDIAEALGISPSHVKNKRYRIFDLLRILYLFLSLNIFDR